MSRRVTTMTLQKLDPSGEKRIDTYFDRVVKYIPSDIVAAWVAVTGIVKAANEGLDETMVLWIAFAAGVALTFAWTWKQTAVADAPPAWRQISISTIAFVIWVIALGSPFDLNPAIGSILLIGFTLVAAMFDP